MIGIAHPMPALRQCKARRKGNDNTGPGAAEIYRSKHHRGGLRQFIRAARIEAELRPLRYDTSWQRGDQ